VESSKDGRGRKKREGLSFYLMGTSERAFSSASFSRRLSLMDILKSGCGFKPLKKNYYKKITPAASLGSVPRLRGCTSDRPSAAPGASVLVVGLSLANDALCDISRSVSGVCLLFSFFMTHPPFHSNR